MRALLPLCALNLALAVGVGAFGAHAFRAQMTDAQLAIYQTGTQYHLAHGLGALLCLSLISRVAKPERARFACWSLLFGCMVFGGTLYTLALTGVRWLGAITPIGGAAFLAGWIALATAGVKEDTV